MSSDYYLLTTQHKRVYLQVDEKKRKQISEIFGQNEWLLERAGLTVQKLTEGEYNAGCSMAALPELGRGIELHLIE